MPFNYVSIDKRNPEKMTACVDFGGDPIFLMPAYASSTGVGCLLLWDSRGMQLEEQQGVIQARGIISGGNLIGDVAADADCVFRFTNTESIDVLISHLAMCKQLMITDGEGL